MTAPSADQLARIESLGLNCEIGNVLRRLGHDTPSLFRWTWVSPRSLLDLMRSDFAGLYDPANLAPGYRNEVLDRRYNVWFHTNVRTGDPEGGTNFRFLDSDTDKRIRIFVAERSIIETLVERFRTRMRTPRTLFVLTRHAREPLGSAEEIAAEIRSRSGNPDFVLLEVHEAPDAARVASTETLGENILRGYVARFAPQGAAHDVDIESWASLLVSVFAMIDPPSMGQKFRRAMRSAFG